MAPGVPVCLCLHDDHWFVEPSVRSWEAAGPVLALVSAVAWNGSRGDWKRCSQSAKAAGAEVITGRWRSESEHRAAALAAVQSRGFAYALIPDGDEVIEASLLQALLKIAEADLADRVYVHWDTYWKSPDYIIRPRERFTPLELVKIEAVRHVRLRDYEGGRALVLGPEHGLVHHLSYAGPNERIKRKLATWGHRDEVSTGWYERVWLRWDADKLLRNIHPTHPEAYGSAERIIVPEVLRDLNLQIETPQSAASNGRAVVLKRWPTVSVVIPLYGGEEDIKLCLGSLNSCRDLLHEVLVVDNASPDAAKSIAASFDFVQVIANEKNEGFARASNQGFEASSGEIILFLNSDTVVPRAGLERLVEGLACSGSIGAAGPLTNACGYDQRIEPTYTRLEDLDLFADDFAARNERDIDAPTDMLVGFCLAVRRSVLEEVGAFDEGFGLGTFEDNDLCYRIRRAGYRLAIANRAFIHHKGSATLTRVVSEPSSLLQKNRKIFEAKWIDDLETGYASHLPGMRQGRVAFDPERSPERRLDAVKELARRADISLCMIVRNEERVVRDCLKSAQPFFSQIVIVDTGSEDRTVDICRECGAVVHQIKWPDSFSVARNESLKHATGNWVFWMDADDTLPFACGETLLHSALNAPKDVAAFVVPVQFVEEVPGMGTRVDHVKLFRNHLGISFEGHIHEQNLPSINAVGGQVARCGAYVLHSGYDTSEVGQKKKRERDEYLLQLDLRERPNHPFVLFNLGMTRHYAHEHADAISWLERCLAVSNPGESHIRKAYSMMAVSQRELGLSGEALSTLLKGLEEVGEDPELRFQAALVLTAVERYAEARSQYEAIRDNLADHFHSVDVSIVGFKRFHNLAGVCLELGDYCSARTWWLKALDEAPHFLPSSYALFDAALDFTDLPTAARMVEHMLQQTGPSEDWAKMGLKYAEMVGGPQNAEGFLISACQLHPHAPGPRLVLAQRLLEAGREGEAVEHLRLLDATGSAAAAFLLGVGATRHGDLTSALKWMERSLDLNPGHAQTVEQVSALRRALGLPKKNGAVAREVARQRTSQAPKCGKL